VMRSSFLFFSMAAASLMLTAPPRGAIA